MKLNKAIREETKLRIGISGASGFGKTYSALLMAFGITEDWDKIAVIDTENGSSNLYSHLGSFNVLELSSPYSPARYIQAIKTCESANMDVIIIDSISHEWQGKGGCLQIHEQLGGRFQDWAKVTPLHSEFLETILNSNSHIITTVRSKINYSMDLNKNGKTKVVKHGLKPITREGLEYEMTLFFELINDNHFAKVSKDRTGIFTGKSNFNIGKSTGRRLIQWCCFNSQLEKSKKEIKSCTTIEGLKHIYNNYSGLKEEVYPHILTRKEELNSKVIKDSIVVRDE